MSRRCLAAIVVTVTASLGVVACGSDNSASTSATTAAPGATTIPGTATSAAGSAACAENPPGANLGLANAGLTLANDQSSFKTLTASAPAGQFALDGIPPGHYTLSATAFEYAGQVAQVDVVPGTTATANLILPCIGPVDQKTSKLTGHVSDLFNPNNVLANTGTGANVITGMFITVDGTATPGGLLATLRLTDWGGRCTSIGQLEPEAPLPLFELFTRGVHLHIGRAMARPVMPAILDLVAAGRLRPQLVTSATVTWDDAPEALLEPATKIVVTRA